MKEARKGEGVHWENVAKKGSQMFCPAVPCPSQPQPRTVLVHPPCGKRAPGMEMLPMAPWFARVRKGGYGQCVEKGGEPGLGVGRQAGDVWQPETGSERDGRQSGGGWEWPGLRGLMGRRVGSSQDGVADWDPGSEIRGPHAPWTLPLCLVVCDMWLPLCASAS